ncbi:hypothetical protein [Adhaeribacter rhizoryzae]|uniref:DUF5050 domain-containing protein n=1 Tax=Adhaeribacter rhizoryzae TaxID=2607907 RepID=A0A5M6DTB8_9BACT|nr:hypothetical protein [Adhaeribacter rhizoryzae]KAA5549509.1 hypothetical protein F0145_02680 [Adhaeribacter rhizoryzae]
MKPNYLLRVLLIAAVLFASKATAQSLTYIRSVPVSKPEAISLDRLSNIYVTDAKNILYKFDPTGKAIQTFSPPATGHVANVEAWNMVKTLLFYDDRQQITLLDRFLTPITSARLSDFTNGIIRTATLAADDRIWLLNESDVTLSKVDIRYPDAVLKTELNQILTESAGDIRFMREYQNNLYMLDRNSGIYIFDNMGNYKKRLPLAGVNYIGFKDEELYYVKENQLIFLNLYNQQNRTINLPAGKNYSKALVGEKFYYFFTSSGFDIYSLH